MKRRSFFKKSLTGLVGFNLLPALNLSRFSAMPIEDNKFNNLIYSNDLSMPDKIKDFVIEGEAVITFPNGKMRMQNKLDPSLGQEANFVNWCPVDFPSNISVRWNFKPIREPGLCILFFAARGLNGESIFDDGLQERKGIYKRYHSGDINTYHISYFRRKHATERAFHTCNLRKSKGFHMAAMGADPIPSVKDVTEPYRIRLDKLNGAITFSINDLKLLEWHDDGKTFGKVLNGGKIGFRQMAPLAAEYSDLKVFTV